MKCLQWSAALATVLMGMASAQAQAPAPCLPDAHGVPRMNAPPDWWTQTGNDWPVSKALDDPRWRGAVHMSYGTGTSENGFVRGLAHKSHDAVYLSWHADVDDGSSDRRRLYLGVSPDDDPTHATIIRFTLKFPDPGDPPLPVNAPIQAWCELSSSHGPACNASQLATYRLYTWDAGQSKFVAQDPETSQAAWIHEHTRFFIHDTPSSGSFNWTLQVRAPLAADIAGGIATTTQSGVKSFRLWSEMRALVSGGLVPYSYPYGAGVVNDLSESSPFQWLDAVPAQDSWATMRVGADPATCTGVSLAVMDVGVVQGGYANDDVTTSLGNQLAGDVDEHTFVARPLNNTAASIAAHQIQARFRIANWGSQPTDPATWDDVVSPSTNELTIAAGQKGVIRATWNMTRDDRCRYGVGRPADACTPAEQTKQAHQCVLADLSARDNIVFANQSVYRNMNFVTTSTRSATVANQAEIDLGKAPRRGFKPARQAYLYLKKRNMPRLIRRDAGDAVRAQVSTLRKGLTSAPMELGRPVAWDRLRHGVRPVKIGKPVLPVRRLFARLPTYEVHVYRFTGKLVGDGDRKRPLLEAQTSFGYVVEPGGKLHGWHAVIDGARKVRPDVYMLKIPGAKRSRLIRTRVQALPSRAAPRITPVPRWKPERRLLRRPIRERIRRPLPLPDAPRRLPPR